MANCSKSSSLLGRRASPSTWGGGGAAITGQISFRVFSSDLSASVDPDSHTFAPQEEIAANLRIEVPDSLRASGVSHIDRLATVMATTGGTLVGGVTVVVRIDN